MFKKDGKTHIKKGSMKYVVNKDTNPMKLILLLQLKKEK
jgi:hypothetical protein